MRDAWIVILAIAALAAGYFLQDFDLFNDKTPDLVMQSDCPLREKTCEVAVPGYGRLSLTVSPVGFKALSVMQIQLDLPQFSPSVSSAEMQFEGLNMDMGYNRVVLDASTDVAGQFSARAMLPACTAEKMFWRFHLFLIAGGRSLDIQFPVEIQP